jgi:Secretion system C-terminal sorting domain
MKKTILLGFTMLFISLVSFSQSVLNVGASQTYTTINAAIVAATNGDTINIVDALHSESGGLVGIMVNKSVVIRGQGAENTIIDGGNTGRVFYVAASGVFIVDLTIQNGQGQDGTSNAGFPGNPGQDGGAIYNVGSLTIQRCVLQNNLTGNGGNGSDGGPGAPGFQSGGAMPGSEDGMPGSPAFDGGSAGNGGAIFNATTATLVIENTSFYQNQTQNGGNGGAGGDGGPGAMGDATGLGDNGGMGGLGGDAGIGGNGGNGGAIFNVGLLTITNSSFVENAIMYPGNGGIGGNGGFGGNGAPIVNPFANGGNGGNGGNGALSGITGSGGAIADSATATIINCTFYHNMAGMTDVVAAGNGGNGGMGGNGVAIAPPLPGFGVGGIGGDAGNGANACDGSYGGGIASAIGTQIINSIISDNMIFPANTLNFGMQGATGMSGFDYMGAPMTPPFGNTGTDGVAGTNGMGIECFGLYNSQGTNLVYNLDPGSMGWIGSDITTVDPQMLTYQDNGGNTPTVGIDSSSIAYNAGTDVHGTLTIPTEDQRGFNRQIPTDIGAFEFRVMPNIVINEVDADQTSTDTTEFIELFSPDGQVPLDEMIVLLYNGSSDLTYDAIDLEGYQTDTAGYFVIGSSHVPNVDIVAFTSNGVQNGADAVALCRGLDYNFPTGSTVPHADSIVDALVYDTNDGDDAGLLLLLNTGEAQIDEDGAGNKDTESNQRIPNGSGGNRNTSTYSQILPTPGAINQVPITISTSTVSSSPYVVTATVGDNIIVPYTITGTFTSGNIFTAYLSDNTGSFASPTAIGTLTSTAAGNISATIPAGTISGTAYRIRVEADSPATVATDNGLDLEVIMLGSEITPTATQTIMVGNNGTMLTVNDSLTPSGTEWMYSTTSGGSYSAFSPTQTGTTYTPNFAMVGTYYVVCVSSYSTYSLNVTSNEVQIDVIVNTGVESTDLKTLNLYPNPTNGIVHIDNIEEYNQINVYNSIGELVYSKTNMDNSTDIDLRTKQKGIYFIQFISEQEIATEKILLK